MAHVNACLSHVTVLSSRYWLGYVKLLVVMGDRSTALKTLLCLGDVKLLTEPQPWGEWVCLGVSGYILGRVGISWGGCLVVTGCVHIIFVRCNCVCVVQGSCWKLWKIGRL